MYSSVNSKVDYDKMSSFAFTLYNSTTEIVSRVKDELGIYEKNKDKSKQEKVRHMMDLIILVKINIKHFDNHKKFMQTILEKLKQFETDCRYFYKEEYDGLISFFTDILSDDVERLISQISDIKVSSEKQTPKNSPSCNVIIGEGSYGMVFEGETSDTVIKRVETNEEDFVEFMFLKSLGNEYSHEFIPEIKEIFVEDKIKVVMDYRGKTLTSIAMNTSYHERIALLPEFLCQMARILVWMKKHNVAHMDIKTDNFCVKDKKLTLIDWGFVGPVCTNSSCYVGTFNFADPSFLGKKRKITHEYDMFSCGVTILSFLGKNYIDTSLDFSTSLEKTLSVSKLYSDIKDAIGEEYVSILKSMIELDEKKRITPEELYNHSLFEELRKKYTIKEEENIKYEFDGNRVGSLLPEERNTVAEWLGEVAEKNNQEFLLNHAVQLLYRTTNKIRTWRSNIQAYGVACYLISNFIFFSQAQNMEFIDASELTANAFTKKVVKNNFIEILQALDWKVYPQYFLPEWNVTFTKDISKKWLPLFSSYEKITEFSDEERVSYVQEIIPSFFFE